MKILVVSLLRLGDVVSITPILQGLRDKYGDELELHLLINKQFESMLPIVPNIDKVHKFDRKQLQKGMGEYQRPLFESADRLKKFIKGLDRENFDLVLNLTQNKLSARLCGLIEAKEYRGMVIRPNGSYEFGSRWFDYLNNHVSRGGQEVLHYTDVFKFGSNLGANKLGVVLQETEEGKVEATKLVGEIKDFVCVQPLTSDLKKNWQLNNFAECLSSFHKYNRETEVVVLGAPFEEQELTKLVDLCQEKGLSIKLVICSLAGALSVIKLSRGLLTLDTSIKHIASSTEVPIFELSLGSSDLRKTGVYRDSAYILTSQVDCYPCSHFSDCGKPSHLCGDSIDPVVVGQVFSFIVNDQQKLLIDLAKTSSNRIAIHRTEFSNSGFWCTHELGKDLSKSKLNELVQMASWKLLNRNEQSKSIGEYGTEGMRLQSFIEKSYPNSKKSNIAVSIGELEDLYSQGERKLASIKFNFSDLIKRGVTIEGDHRITKDVEEVSGLSLEIKEEKKGRALSFVELRQLQNLLAEETSRNQIKMKIIRSLKSQIVGSI